MTVCSYTAPPMACTQQAAYDLSGIPTCPLHLEKRLADRIHDLRHEWIHQLLITRITNERTEP